MRETQVWSLSQEDPLEKGMAIHFSFPAWRIPWTEEPGSTGAPQYWLNNTFTFTDDKISHAVKCDKWKAMKEKKKKKNYEGSAAVWDSTMEKR